MFRVGTIIVLVSLVVAAILNAGMLLRILQRLRGGSVCIGETLSILFFAGLTRDYLRILSEAGITPTAFDHGVSALERFFLLLLIVGVITATVGLIIE